MRVTFLGTGTSSGVPVPACACAVCRSEDPRDERLRPSVLLDWDGASVLVDASTDLRLQALRQRIERIDAVLLTHAHADHILGLDELRQYNWRQGGPIPLYGAAATLDAVRRTFWYAFDTRKPESSRPAVTLQPVDGPFLVGGRPIQPIPLWHGSLPVFGYRIGRFAYLTDVSRIPEASYPLLEGLDTLVLSALRPRPHPTHLSLAQSLAEARRIGARRTFFTHMSHDVAHDRENAALPPSVRLAYDGLRIRIEG